MINFFVSFLMIVFFMPSIAQAMDNPTPITIDKQPFGRVINVPNIRRIKFLGNDEIMCLRFQSRPVLINLTKHEQTCFSDAKLSVSHGGLATDQSKKRALLSRHGDGYTTIKIYDSASKQVIDAKIDHNDYTNKMWWSCFDESKPTSILMQKGMPSSVISYDYMNGEITPDNFISKVFNNDNLLIHRYIFNPLLQSKAVVSGYYGGFRIDYESESNSHKDCPVKSISSDKNYVCSLDMAFIAHYSDMAQDVANSPRGDDDNCRNILTGTSGCCITNIETGNSLYLQYDKEVRVPPCSMKFHPNNKVLVTMSAGDRNIEYWQADTAQLLAIQELPADCKGNFFDEVGTLRQYLDFSANGELLAAVLPDKGTASKITIFSKTTIFNVPFEAQCDVQKNKLICLWWCLKNYIFNGTVLPEDIVRLLFGSLKY